MVETLTEGREFDSSSIKEISYTRARDDCFALRITKYDNSQDTKENVHIINGAALRQFEYQVRNNTDILGAYEDIVENNKMDSTEWPGTLDDFIEDDTLDDRYKGDFKN